MTGFILKRHCGWGKRSHSLSVTIAYEGLSGPKQALEAPSALKRLNLGGKPDSGQLRLASLQGHGHEQGLGGVESRSGHLATV